MRPSPPAALPAAAPAAALATALLVAACGPDDPQLAMCQGLAKQLVGEVAAWERTEQKDSTRVRDVSIHYSTNGDASGTIECRYPIDAQNGTVATAPSEVVLNGRRLETGELFAAGTRASGKLIAETADETADRTRDFAENAGERTRELADEVSVRARELAEQARDVAAEGGKALRETLDR